MLDDKVDLIIRSAGFEDDKTAATATGRGRFKVPLDRDQDRGQLLVRPRGVDVALRAQRPTHGPV